MQLALEGLLKENNELKKEINVLRRRERVAIEALNVAIDEIQGGPGWEICVDALNILEGNK